MQKTPVKIAAERLEIPVLQFEQVKSDEAFLSLQTLSADAAVVASFGQIIPQRVLDLYPKGAINVHGSLLPKYRGASPIREAIVQGDAETGNTIMLMDAKMDHGPILASRSLPIAGNDTTESLTPKLAHSGAELLVETLPRYFAGEIAPVEQQHNVASFVKLLTREDGRLDPSRMSAEALERLVRANILWPGSFIEVHGKRLKVLKSHVASTETDHSPSQRTIFEHTPALVCSDDRLLVLDIVQPEGKPPLEGAAFLRGSRDWLSD